MLSAAAVTKNFRGITAVNNVSLELTAGTITGLIGQNGSGKSTLIDCVTGFQPFEAGAVSFRDVAITAAKPEQIALKGMVRTFQQVAVYGELTVNENLLAAAQEHQDVSWWDAIVRTSRLREAERQAMARAAELIDLFGLGRCADAPASFLSYGQKKLVSLACCLMARPKLIILDEPLAGVNPTRIREIEEIIRKLNKAGETFLIVEHHIEMIMSICHRVVVLDQGRLIADGPPEEVRSNPQVIEAYLGGRAA